MYLSIGWYQYFTTSIWYYKFRVAFGISQYLSKQNCTRKIVELTLLITVSPTRKPSTDSRQCNM